MTSAWSRAIVAGVGAYVVTTILFLAGIVSGIHRGAHAGIANSQDSLPADTSLTRIILAALTSLNGREYVEIADQGYLFSPSAPSTVALFPGYPLLVRSAVHLLRCSTQAGAVLVTHVSLAAALCLLAKQALDRWGASQSKMTLLFLGALGLFPAGIFLRMAYSEAVFLAALAATMYAISKNAPLVLVALLAGLATAMRPVAIVLVPVFVLYAWRSRGSTLKAASQAMLFAPLAGWGVILFSVYLQWQFGDGLAWCVNQDRWFLRPPVPWQDKLWALASLEPIWSVYVPQSLAYWQRHDPRGHALTSIVFWNPVFFVAAVGLVAYGAWRRWLTCEEVVLSVGLLAIPYVSRSFEMCMTSQGRFVSVIFPVFIVAAHVLSRWPRVVAAAVLVASAVLFVVIATHVSARISVPVGN